MEKSDRSSDNVLVFRARLQLPFPYVPPRNETERKLAEIWRLALGMDCVGVEDNYNDLGGDSLTAEQIFILIEETFEIKILTATLLTTPTVARLAQEVDRYLAAGSEGPGSSDGLRREPPP